MAAPHRFLNFLFRSMSKAMFTTANPKRPRSRGRSRKRRQKRSRRQRKSRALPSWSDLSGTEKRPLLGAGFLAGLSTMRFALVVLAVAGACALYVGHVHATQALLSSLEQARAENQRLHLKKSRLQSAFNEATAPSVIYRRAEELGLEEGLSRGPTIHVGASSDADSK